MKNTLSVLLALFLVACTQATPEKPLIQDQFSHILDITYTPDTLTGGRGWFTDQGSWMGFTLPAKGSKTIGFCGPFDLDSRKWISQSLIQAAFDTPGDDAVILKIDSTNYIPGAIRLTAGNGDDLFMNQEMMFIDKNHAIIAFTTNKEQNWLLHGKLLSDEQVLQKEKENLIISLSGGEILALSFEGDVRIETNGKEYTATTDKKKQTYAVISYFNHKKELVAGLQKAAQIIASPDTYIKDQRKKWNDYLEAVIRPELPEQYNRIAAKSVVTLLSNWRSAKGGLLHDGVVPSHAVGYFVGFWAWDSWKHAYALAKIAPSLAKDQIRTMFDYQTPEGMVIDCIYTNSEENNPRDSKPPLAAWAVNRIYEETKDTAFVKEIYPQLVKYHNWWYENRDHNGNQICEFGSTDGTEEAAKWESGMDNAIRFDQTGMVKNNDQAWSFNQESVDLNAFLIFEKQLLRKLSPVAGMNMEIKGSAEENANYFFDEKDKFFYDKSLKGDFIREQGSESYIPLWAGIASQSQADNAMNVFKDTSKFSTYIPFPTVAADNPKFMPKGYWRGPIWLDQVYFGINGIRNYGYKAEADTYTEQVFDRLDGLQGTAPIHENYGTHTGERLKAPHFSWSAAHLLMLFEEYKN